MPINKNKDYKQNYQHWKHLQFNKTRSINKEDDQKVY